MTDKHKYKPDRRTVLKGLGGAGMISLAGCSGTTGGGGGDPLKIGVTTAFSGQYAWLANQTVPGVKTAIATANNNGGIAGRQVKMVTADTKGTIGAAVGAVRNLINSEQIDLLIGPSSLVYKGVFDIIQKNNVPNISHLAGTTWLNTRGGEYVYRTVPADNLGGIATGIGAANEEYNGVESYESMAVIVEDAPAMAIWADPVKKGFKAKGGTITYSTKIDPKKPAYQSTVAEAVESDPDIMFVAARPQNAGKIFTPAYQRGYRGNFIMPDDPADAVSEAESEVVNNALKVIPAQSQKAVEQGRIEYFQSKFKEVIGGEIPGTYTSRAFDATTLGMLAMLAASQDGEITRKRTAEKIRPVANPPGEVVSNYPEGMKKINNGTETDFQGTGGPINFDKHGNVTAPFKILRYTGTEWKRQGLVPASEIQEVQNRIK